MRRQSMNNLNVERAARGQLAAATARSFLFFMMKSGTDQDCRCTISNDYLQRR
jgi:hypothetical protein